MFVRFCSASSVDFSNHSFCDDCFAVMLAFFSPFAAETNVIKLKFSQPYLYRGGDKFSPSKLF